MSGGYERRTHHVVGLFLVVLGGALLSERLGLFSISGPILLAIGVSALYLALDSWRDTRSVLAGIAAALGIVMITNGLGLTRISFSFLWHIVWPLLLILFGIWLIGTWDNSRWNRGPQVFNLISDYSLVLGQDETVGNRTVWSLIGDVQVDFSRCNIPEGVTHLMVHSAIGDTVITVPDDVAVEVHTTTVLGDMDLFHEHYEGIFRSGWYRSSTYEANPRRIRIYVRSLLGDIDVQRG